MPVPEKVPRCLRRWGCLLPLLWPSEAGIPCLVFRRLNGPTGSSCTTTTRRGALRRRSPKAGPVFHFPETHLGDEPSFHLQGRRNNKLQLASCSPCQSCRVLGRARSRRDATSSRNLTSQQQQSIVNSTHGCEHSSRISHLGLYRSKTNQPRKSHRHSCPP